VDAGYSGTPQLKKLGIVPGVRFAVVGAPVGWWFESEPDAAVHVHGKSAADVVLAFARTEHEVRESVASEGERIRPSGALWIAWPRKAAGHVSEVTENLLREVALPIGLVDVKVAALDADWSALKLVWRREKR
jgi:hypothetical protein